MKTIGKAKTAKTPIYKGTVRQTFLSKIKTRIFIFFPK